MFEQFPARLFETGDYEHTYRFRLADGSYRRIYDCLRLCRAERGQPAEVNGFWLDLTRHKRANRLLQANEERYRLLFESSRDALMLLAPPSWKFIGANQATLRMFGASSVAEFTALEPWVVSPERQPDGHPSSEKAQEMIAAAMREGSHFFEWEHQRLDGQPFAADVLLTRMEVAGDLFLQATVRDITARKKLEAESEQLISELEEALANIKTLEKFLPICASCKKIRDEKGYWDQIESYITKHSGTEFSHSICPECAEKLYSEFNPYT